MACYAAEDTVAPQQTMKEINSVSIEQFVDHPLFASAREAQAVGEADSHKHNK